MKLDREFAKEIKRVANGDGSREARFAFLKEARAAAKDLSTTKAAEVFDDTIREHGRVAVGIVTAATIIERSDRLESETVRWARAVLELYTNRPSTLSSLHIDDGLHPPRIEEYAGQFIRLTTEED